MSVRSISHSFLKDYPPFESKIDNFKTALADLKEAIRKNSTAFQNYPAQAPLTAKSVIAALQRTLTSFKGNLAGDLENLSHYYGARGRAEVERITKELIDGYQKGGGQATNSQARPQDQYEPPSSNPLSQLTQGGGTRTPPPAAPASTPGSESSEEEVASNDTPSSDSSQDPSETIRNLRQKQSGLSESPSATG